jgi:hypothetical protein
MLNITTAKPFLIEIDKQIKERITALNRCHLLKAWNAGTDIAVHLAELKELRYQLAMSPERVLYAGGTDHAQ